VVSGMARGIDTIAHKTAVTNKGYRVAILGSGVDVVYPKENLKLYNEIISRI
ncbi:MAG: DNA-processing protein DprA, partial [Lactococcus sp.]